MDCYLQMLKQGWHQHQHITKRTTITVKTIHSIVTFFIFIDLFILLTLEKSSLCLFSIPYLILFSRVESQKKLQSKRFYFFRSWTTHASTKSKNI